METLKPDFSTRARVAWLVTACLVSALSAGEPTTGSGLAERERTRRSAAIEEAQELLRKGDQSYQAGNYADASEAYAGALELIPDAPVSAELRGATAQRYAQAAVEHARAIARKGDVAKAKATVDKVLRENIAPNNPEALAFRAQLDDPIRTNPALSVEHAKDVDAVRRLLYTAQGASNLGKFDEAMAQYQQVLVIDPTNTAARRGMEQVAAAKSNYHHSAHDHTRAELLGQVAAGWELPLTATEPEPGGAAGPGADSTPLGPMTVASKLEQIIIPKVALDEVTLDEAIDFLRVRAVECDTFEANPARKGVNFNLNLGAPDSPIAMRIRSQRITLRLTHVPISQILKQLTDFTKTHYTTDEFAVLITPAGSTANELLTRSYRVPPDFLSSLSSDTSSTDASADPFATTAPPKAGGLLTTRLSARDALAKQGITFPEGASVNYSATTNTLTVINTASNQDFIAQLVDTMTRTEPVTVVVRVTMIRSQQTNLKELGFDWLVSPFAVNSKDSLFASGGTIGSGTPRTGEDFLSPVDGAPISGVPLLPGAQVNPGVVTNGLRSGDYAINTGLDSLVANSNRSAQTQSVAPGILSVTGLFSDSQAQLVMRGLNQKKGVDIMAQPSIVTRSGQSSKLSIVREFIYPTEYEPPQLPQSVNTNGTSPTTPANPTAFDEKDIGVALEVLPIADANKRFVEITLSPTFSSFAGFVNYGTPINTTINGLLGPEKVEITANEILMPIFNVHRLATQLTVADGSTIAIGGLLQEQVQNVEDKVPLFGSIPIVGRLFQTTVKQPVTTAIVFLVHIELLDPTGRPYRNR